MPFKSERQRRFMWAKHPEVAKRWESEYPAGSLEEKVSKKRRTKKNGGKK